LRQLNAGEAPVCFERNRTINGVKKTQLGETRRLLCRNFPEIFHVGVGIAENPRFQANFVYSLRETFSHFGSLQKDIIIIIIIISDYWLS